MNKSVPTIPKDILFAAQQLMYREVHNFFQKALDGEVVLSNTLAGPLNDCNIDISTRKSLLSIIEDVAYTYSVWITENTLGLDTASHTGVVTFPYFLRLGGVACILDQLWPLIPICSCCKLPVKLGTTIEDEKDCWGGGSFSTSLNITEYPVAKSLTLIAAGSKSNFKFLFCDHRLDCEQQNGLDCDCGLNKAFLLDIRRILPNKVPSILSEQINNEIYQ
jgi:hypothetical protein